METGNKILCQGKDVFERMNFLYQASQAIASKDINVSSFYGDVLTKCSKKAVLRLSTDVKRSICKSCQSPLIPGQTATVRLQTKPLKCIKWRCLTCGYTKKYPNKKGYKLWSDNSEAIVQEYNYGQKMNKKNNDKIEIKNKSKVEPMQITETSKNPIVEPEKKDDQKDNNKINE